MIELLAIYPIIGVITCWLYEKYEGDQLDWQAVYYWPFLLIVWCGVIWIRRREHAECQPKHSSST